MAVHPTLLHRLDAVSPVQWRIYSFELPYLSGGVRKGLLVHIKNEQQERWAEIAPLPGRSSESQDLALQQLIDCFSGKAVQDLCRSVQIGLENLFSSPLESTTARLYALLSGTPDEVLQQAEIASAQGYCTVKVKVSSFSIAAAQKILGSLQKRFRLRVDCNSAFSFDEAISLFSPFDPAVFDYIEDPTYAFKRLPEFTHPFALDETVSQYRSISWENSNLYGFILKPTILGGVKGCAPLIDFAKKHQLKVVFSPAFESGVGLLQILSTAKHFGLLEDLIGLDTYRYLKYDLLMPSINFSTSKLTVNALPQVNLQLLTEIAHGRNHLPYL